MVAVAVPVWNNDRSEVIGVLARTLHLSDLLSQWELRINSPDLSQPNPAKSGSSQERLLSLLDMRQQPPMLLDHDWMQRPEFRQSTNEEKLKKILQLTPEEELRLREAVRKGEGIPNYRDPLAQQDPAYDKVWLAAVARTPKVDWFAIVQERLDEAVAPMSVLNQMFLRYGLLMLVVSVSMLILLGWLIQRAAET
jgi:hypothetical protein